MEVHLLALKEESPNFLQVRVAEKGVANPRGFGLGLGDQKSLI